MPLKCSNDAQFFLLTKMFKKNATIYNVHEIHKFSDGSHSQCFSQWFQIDLHVVIQHFVLRTMCRRHLLSPATLTITIYKAHRVLLICVQGDYCQLIISRQRTSQSNAEHVWYHNLLQLASMIISYVIFIVLRFQGTSKVCLLLRQVNVMWLEHKKKNVPSVRSRLCGFLLLAFCALRLVEQLCG